MTEPVKSAAQDEQTIDAASSPAKDVCSSALPMPHVPVLELERECHVFAKYLLGLSPSRYVLDQYVGYHARRGLPNCKGSQRFDRLLLRIARTAPWGARLADSYASMHFRSATVRKKLVLLLGILECVPAGAQRIDACRYRNVATAAAAMMMQYIGYLTCVVVATLILSPIHLLLRVF